VYLRDFPLFCFGNRVSDISRQALHYQHQR
jgi:hypothetical protein